VRRQFSCDKGRSFCFIENKKVTKKVLVATTSPLLRTWFADDASVALKQPSSARTYIDSALSSRGLHLLKKLKFTSNAWYQASREEAYLTGLQENRLGTDKKLLLDYCKELSELASRCAKVVDMAMSELDRLDQSGMLRCHQGEDRAYILESDILASNLTALRKLTRCEGIGGLMNLDEGWIALNNLRSLFQFLIIPEGQGDRGVDLLESCLYSLHLCSEGVCALQIQFTELGLNKCVVSEILEDLIISLQNTSDSVSATSSTLVRIREIFCHVESVVGAIDGLFNTWEAIARKHNERPGCLQKILSMWRAELIAIDNVSFTLPHARAELSRISSGYSSLASELSALRLQSAATLSNRVNRLLPELDLADLRVNIEVTPPDSNTPLEKLVHIDGWDTISFNILRMGHQVHMSTLSAGELARIALVLEESLPVNQHGFFGSSGEKCLMVYDEIDAHIGGEAAVAVARLLRRLSGRRKVIAITHNPIIAAAAQRHLVVSRAPGSGSVIKEINMSEREVEIGRMAAGDIEVYTGMELARKLMLLDYRYPSNNM
jgi:DNA repair protein RecN (Recombination protein N)